MCICRMITLKCLLISILFAYLGQIILTSLLSSARSKNDLKSEIIPVVNPDEIEFKTIFEKTCRVNNSDALSALRRAKTQECKYKIANIACQVQDGNFYPKSLPNYCPNNGMTYGKYLGCYADKMEPRSLPDFYAYNEKNTRINCLNSCVLGGFPYAGVQYGAECFCGNDAPSPSEKLPENACDMKCSGNSTETCGGSLTINVFETGVAKFTSAPLNAPSNSTEEPAKMVFVLTVSGRALRQIHRLINALYRSNHFYFIHVDLRHDYLHRNLLLLEKQLPNVKLVKNRFSTIWAGASYLRMLLSVMKDLLDSDWHWDFIINMSESDFPIKPIEELEAFLSANKNLNFAGAHHINVIKYVQKQGLDKTFVECDERMWLIGDRELPNGITIDGASDWLMLSRNFVSYVIEQNDELLVGLDHIFKYTLMPPESYFQVILRNSRFCDKYVDNQLRLINWIHGKGCQCHRKVIDWCGCSPLDFRSGDIDRIKNTKGNNDYLARKFESIINIDIINKVEEFIGFNDHHLIDNLNSYWENIYNNEDTVYSQNRELLRSHGESITRINAKKLKEDGCEMEPSTIIDINVYKYSDIYWGNLILYNAFLNGQDILLETWYRPVPRNMERNPDTELAKRLKVLEVSSDYTEKEKVFKNFANILGPYSDVTLFYEFKTSDEDIEENFIIKWYEPSGIKVNVSKILIKKDEISGLISPNLRTPLKPGIWTAKLFKNKLFLSSTKFLVIPVESLQQYKATTKMYTQIPKPHLQKSLEYDFEDDTENDDIEKLNDIQERVLNLTDSLNVQFYNVIDTCVSQTSQVKEPIKCGNRVINICESERWSSLYPDPKGSVGILNVTTGRLDRVKV